MAFVATARKWRPMVFEDVVGQSHITTTLRNAISGNRLSHAYIFSGPRGVGKTTTARILARAVNCLSPVDSNPDNQCELCRELIEGRSVNVFEIDGASNRGIEEIRNLRDAVRYGPGKGAYKIYIIDEVHMLTKDAFNALLKTLEEPPPYIVFIFATTEVQKVPLTILSRCQRFDFRRNTIDEMVSRMRHIADAESIPITDDALALIARKGDGSMRDSQSIFDQVVSFSTSAQIDAEGISRVLNIVDQEMFFRVTELLKAKDSAGMLQLVDEIFRRGYDLREFLGGLVEHLRNYIVVLSTGSTDLIETGEAYKPRYADGARGYTQNMLLRLISLVQDTDAGLRWSQPAGGGRYRIEVGLLKMMTLNEGVPIDSIMKQLEDLKKNIDSGTPALERTSRPAEQRETLVRGTVKASQPILREDQIVREKSAAFSMLTPRSPAARQTAAQPVTASQLAEKWPLFVDETKKQRVDLWAMLSDSNLLETRENEIRIACRSDIHLESFKRNREVITQLAQQVYGSRIRFEAIVADASTGLNTAPTQAAGNQQPSNLQVYETLSDHPLIQTLMKEFGARPVQAD